MAEPIIVNYIEIANETFLLDELPEDKKLRVGEVMQKRLMEPIGYKSIESA